MILRIKCFLAILFMVAFAVAADAQINEDFSDGDFTTDPAWTSSNESGAGSDWLITTNELQSNGPAASTDIWLSTAGTNGFAASLTQWEFKARYLTSGPSSSNRITIFLVSDKSDLTDNPQGYYIQLGETGSDDGIDFYKTTSATPLIADPNPSVSSGIDANIRVTRSLEGEWTLEADPNGGTSFSTIGTVTDTEITTGDNFGFLVSHTSTRNEDFYIDDITVDFTDVVAPSISSVNVISSNELDILFSEEVEITSSEDISNYTVNNGIGNPTTVTLDASDSRLVHLSFATAFSNPSTNEISVSNVEDQAGNVMTTEVEEFFYFEEQPANYKDIIINEIMAAPNDENGLPNAEFIELYNNSTTTFDLENWTFSDATTESTLTSQFLSPGEYVILCKTSDVSAFSVYVTTLGVSSFPTLNNSGDQLSLKDNNGVLIDSVSYSNTWYNDEDKDNGGWSLELIDPENLCGQNENWSASVASEGGTPGAVNSIYDLNFDTSPPAIKSVIAVSKIAIEITFDQIIDPASVDVSDFSIDQGKSFDTVEAVDNVISLTLNTPLDVNTLYSVGVTDVSDCSGNLLTTTEMAEVIFVQGLTPEFKDLVINEIFADPSPPNDLPEEEFVEIYNRSDKIFDLENWTFSDQATQAVISKVVLLPGEFLILCPSDAVLLYQPYGKTIGLPDWPSLNNSEDILSIYDNTGTMVDQVAYKDDWYKSSSKQEGGWTLELIDPENLCGEEENWIAADVPLGGTPGDENSVYAQNPDLTSPQLLQAVALTTDSLILKFNEKLDTTNLAGIAINIEPNVSIAEVIFTSSITDIIVKTNDQFLPETAYEVTVNDIRDCSGNAIDSDWNKATFGVIEKAEGLDLVINEILFNPRSGGEDFVEVYNVSQKYINLKGWKLTNAEFEQDDSLTLKTQREITNSDLVLAPNDYLVLTEDNIVLIEQYPLGKVGRFLEVDIPSYPNEEGIAVLLDSSNDIIDLFAYNETLHSPLLDDVDGISLERVSPFENTDNTDNWKSAVASVGFATPGYENSQSRPGIEKSRGELTISPKVIIPDGSGTNDFATITYDFTAAGNVGTMRIMDVQGREIKIIAQNEFLGSNGFFTWDGTDENGRQVRIGYYLVVFEIFDANGGLQMMKEKIAIGSRF
ncbi:MAG: lamin tail domain-containing protein [Fulvivirga sp.]